MSPGRILYNWPDSGIEEALRFASPEPFGREPHDVAIVGAGIVGCALACELSRYALRVLLVDKAFDVGQGASKSNAGVVATPYDAPPGSLDSRLLREASRRWPEFSERLKIPYRRIGAMVMAMDARQREKLDEGAERARANGVEGVEVLSAGEARDLEPHIAPGVRGVLRIPGEAVGDPFTTSVALAEVALRNGTDILLGAPVTRIEDPASGVKRLVLGDGRELRARRIVNATGLGGRKLADLYGGAAFDIHPRRGQMVIYDPSSHSLLSHMLAPLPQADHRTRGIVVTPTIYGNLLAGPTAEDLPPDRVDATETTLEGLREAMEGAARFLPALRYQPPICAYAGLRCVCDQGNYIVRFNDGHQGFVTITGVRSTGFSSSFVLAEYVARGMKRECDLTLREDPGATDGRPESAWPGWWRRPFERDGGRLASPDAGRVVCFCENITRQEIVDALNSPLRPRTLDGIKRRTRALTGRCQGFDCAIPVAEIISEVCSIPIERVTKNGPGSEIVAPRAHGSPTVSGRPG